MKKIIISSIILITLISAFSNCLAFEIGRKDLVSLGPCEVYLEQDGSPKHTDYVVYRKDGIEYPAYCIDPELNGIGTAGIGNYGVDVENKLTDVRIWRALINGYPYKSIEELGVANKYEAFSATKFATYIIYYNIDTSYYNPVNTDAGRRTYQALLKIVDAARNSNETPNNNQISILDDAESWIVESNEYVSKIYTLNSKVAEGEYSINVTGDLPNGFKLTDLNNKDKSNFSIGEKFKVIIPIKELLKDGTFTLNVESTIKTKPVLFGKTTIPGTQNYAITGYMYEDAKCTYTENYLKNSTKMVIIKKEYGTEERLENVKFNILDENKNIVIENIATDENGEIALENILPGKYYISEIETLEGYSLYTDLIEIELELNDEFEIVVNNSKEEKTQIDKNFESIEVSSTSTENVYNVENNTTKINKDNVENKTIMTNKDTVESNTTIKNNIKKLPVTGC